MDSSKDGQRSMRRVKCGESHNHRVTELLVSEAVGEELSLRQSESRQIVRVSDVSDLEPPALRAKPGRLGCHSWHTS